MGESLKTFFIIGLFFKEVENGFKRPVSFSSGMVLSHSHPGRLAYLRKSTTIGDSTGVICFREALSQTHLTHRIVIDPTSRTYFRV